MTVFRDGVAPDPTSMQSDIAALQVLTAIVATDSVPGILSAADHAALTAAKLKEKNLRALTLAGTIHQLADAGVSGLSALAGTETQAQTDTQAEALRTALHAHLLAVGTYAVDGPHKAADTALAATLAAIPAATEINSCIVLVNGLKSAFVPHGASSGVHFHDDTTTASATITTDPPTTKAQCQTDLNDILALCVAHFAKASV